MHYDFKKSFDSKQIKIQELMKSVTVNNDTGYVTIHVNRVEDVLSTYSITGYEFLNGVFKSVLSKYIAYIPAHFPMVLEITGCEFTEAEKESIQNAIWHEYEYDYLTEFKGIKHAAMRSVVGLGFALVFLAYLIFGNPASIVVDLVWIPLWTLLDPLISLFWYVIPNFRQMKRRLIQCQTMKILYTKEYKDIAPSQETLSKIHEDIIANAMNEEV